MADADPRPEGWDYSPDRRPARSLLAAIPPLAIGTPLAEDLGSYISRLSWEHMRAPSRLVRDVLAPSLGHAASPAADAAAWEEELVRVTRHPASSLIGHAPVAATWADALAAATGNPDLRMLTLLPWSDVLPRKWLLRSERAWCPACLELWRLRGRHVYLPLLWQIAEVTSCVEHEVRLVTECPACGRTGGVLTAWARVGHCRCGEWLGGLWFHEGDLVDGDDLDWQRYVSNQVGSMIATTPRLPGPVSGALTAEAVVICWTRTGMSLTRLAASLGMALSTVSLWKDGRRQPSLSGVLRLCRVAGVELVDFLRGDLEALRSAAPASREIPFVRPSDGTYREIDWEAVRGELDAALTTDPPVSLASILRRFALDTRQAKRAWPTECSAVAARYRSWKIDGAKGRLEHDIEIVREVIAQLRSEGVTTSRHQVQKRLPGSLSLRRPKLYAIWEAEGRDPHRRFLKV